MTNLNRKTFAAAALAATAALSLTACIEEPGNADTADVSDAALSQLTIYPKTCTAVSAAPAPYSRIIYDFKHGFLHARTGYSDGTITGHTIHFNTISMPAVQAEISTIHAALPAAAACPAPVYATTTAPAPAAPPAG